MADMEYPAVEKLCKMLDSLPGEWRTTAIMFACFALGEDLPSTGLQPTSERRLKHLHWDLTTKELRQRLHTLIEQERISQHVLVHGVVGLVEQTLWRFADRECRDEALENQARKLAELEGELQLAVESRRVPISDKELVELIEMIRNSVENNEQKRKSAESALQLLQRSAADEFTSDFWKELERRDLDLDN